MALRPSGRVDPAGESTRLQTHRAKRKIVVDALEVQALTFEWAMSYDTKVYSYCSDACVMLKQARIGTV
jgi:hypothetical protein